MKYTPEQLLKFSNLIKEGHNISSACKLTDINVKSSHKIIKRLNIKVINKFSNNTIKGNYFNQIDSENKAYFLGLILADGYITEENKILKNKLLTSKRLGISLKEEDSYILEIFSKDLNLNKNLKKLSKSFRKDQSVLRFSNKMLIDNLINTYNIIPKKTYDTNFTFPFEKIPLKYLKDFIRGFFDGDGSVSFYKTNNSFFFNFSFISTSLSFINQIAEIFEKRFQIKPYIYKKQGKTVDYYSLRFNYDQKRLNKIKDIYNWIYKDSNVFLKRKKIKFENYFEYLGK